MNCAEMSITLALPSHRGGGGDDAATAAAAATSAAAAPAAPGRRWREFYRGPPMRQLSAASSTNLTPEYAGHPGPSPPQHQPPYDGKS